MLSVWRRWRRPDQEPIRSACERSGSVHDDPDGSVRCSTRSSGSPLRPARPILVSRDVSNIYSGDKRWGGWGSNPRPADYEKPGLVHRTR